MPNDFIGVATESATYEELYSGDWKHPVAAAAGG